jgi:ferredoxin
LRPFLLSQKKKIVTPQQMSFVTSKFLHKRAEVSVTFIRLDGTKLPAKGKEGENLLDIIIDQEIDIDGFGACEGTLACSTCHLIFKQTDFDKIPDEATDEELDMLDLAYGLTDTSRLGCQVCLTKELEGLEVQVPEGINDQR